MSSATIESVPHELDFFSSNPYNLCVEKYEDIILSPVNSLDTNSQVEFFLNGHPNAVKSISEIYLMGTLQFKKISGVNYKEADKAQPYLINGGLSSLFKSCSLYLNQILVSNQPENFGLVSYVCNVLNFNETTASSRLPNMGVFSLADQDRLKTQLKNSRKLELISKLNMLNPHKHLLNNVSLTVKLNFHSPRFYIVEQSVVEGSETIVSESKLEIGDLKLIVRQYNLRQNMLNFVEAQLARKYRASYEFKRIESVTVSLAASQTSYANVHMWNGLKPSMMLLFFIDNETFNGKADSDPMIFKNFGLSRVSFTINNEELPPRGFTISAANTEVDAGYAHAYHALLDSLSMNYENSSNLVTHLSYPNHHFIIGYDCSAYSNALSTLQQPLEMANVGYTVQFASPLKKALTAVLMLLLPAKVEISGDRSISVIY